MLLFFMSIHIVIVLKHTLICPKCCVECGNRVDERQRRYLLNRLLYCLSHIIPLARIYLYLLDSINNIIINLAAGAAPAAAPATAATRRATN